MKKLTAVVVGFGGREAPAMLVAMKGQIPQMMEKYFAL